MECSLIHFTPLSERLTSAIIALTSIGLVPSLITEHKGASLYSQLSSTCILSKVTTMKTIAMQVADIYSHLSCNLSELRKTRNPQYCDLLYRSFLASVISPSHNTIEHTCQHLFAIHSASNRSDLPFLLVLEDDALPVLPNVCDLLFQILKNAGLSCGSEFFIDLGQGLGLGSHQNSRDRSGLRTYAPYPVAYGRTRCSYAYLLSIPACKSLSRLSEHASLFPLMPSDWHLSVLLTAADIPTYWLSQPLFDQGSENGMFPSNQHFRCS